ncbi:hypothetical protein HanPSC8_Chr06g0232701 [Helianthus annuus]|nr:hypothetical protein HanPSC8_Chr06g0232701 [Helianthus annuus]
MGHFSDTLDGPSIISLSISSNQKQINTSKMQFSSLRFGQFCNFRSKVCFSYMHPKGLKSCHFHPAH